MEKIHLDKDELIFVIPIGKKYAQFRFKPYQKMEDLLREYKIPYETFNDLVKRFRLIKTEHTRLKFYRIKRNNRDGKGNYYYYYSFAFASDVIEKILDYYKVDYVCDSDISIDIGKVKGKITMEKRKVGRPRKNIVVEENKKVEKVEKVEKVNEESPKKYTDKDVQVAIENKCGDILKEYNARVVEFNKRLEEEKRLQKELEEVNEQVSVELARYRYLIDTARKTSEK